jgi:hypothetical protein
MFEAGNCLETYRVDAPPEQWSQKPTAATRIPDHPAKFLTYQGSVNQSKGLVEIADAGSYQIVEQCETGRKIRFDGGVLKGQFVLVHTAGEKYEVGPP